MKKLGIISFGITVSFLIVSCAPKGQQQEEETKAETKTEKAEQPAAPNTLTQAEKEDGWVLLFDGTTTNGWRGYNQESFPEKGWEVVDGTLT